MKLTAKSFLTITFFTFFLSGISYSQVEGEGFKSYSDLMIMNKEEYKKEMCALLLAVENCGVFDKPTIQMNHNQTIIQGVNLKGVPIHQMIEVFQSNGIWDSLKKLGYSSIQLAGPKILHADRGDRTLAFKLLDWGDKNEATDENEILSRHIQENCN